jgi:hypothetical protein
MIWCFSNGPTQMKPSASRSQFSSLTQRRRSRGFCRAPDRGERDLSFLAASGNQIILRYLRVASASCSIPRSGETCWSKLKQQTGLIHSPMPKCSDYEDKYAGTAASVIAYPVEVSLFPKPSIPHSAPRSSATPLSDSPIERVSLRTATCPRSRAPKEVIAHRLPSVPVWAEPSQLLIGQLPFRS